MDRGAVVARDARVLDRGVRGEQGREHRVVRTDDLVRAGRRAGWHQLVAGGKQADAWTAPDGERRMARGGGKADPCGGDERAGCEQRLPRCEVERRRADVPARFGRGGMIKDISDRLLSEFVDCLKATVSTDPGTGAAAGEDPGSAEAPVSAAPSGETGTAAGALPGAPASAESVPPAGAGASSGSGSAPRPVARPASRPPAKPVSAPDVPMTRWHGTTIDSGLRPLAAPTARTALSRPMAWASAR